MRKVSKISEFELLHNLHLIISKRLKESKFKDLGSHGVTTKPDGVVENKQPLNQMKVSILRGVHSLLAAIEQKAGVSSLRIDFFSKRLVHAVE